MAKSKLTKKVLTFEYMVAESKVVKFIEESAPLTVSDKVAKLDMAKFKITKGTKVDVSINEDNVVQFVAKAKIKEEKQQTTSTKQENSNGKVLTIHGIPNTKKVIKFKEVMDKWYDVSSELQKEDLKARGIVARAKVNVVIETIDGNETITSITAIGEESSTPEQEQQSTNEKDTVPELPQTSGGYYPKNTSIERQCAWKTAGEVLGKVLENQVSINDVSIIKEKMRELAEEGIKFIQNT